MNFLELAEHIAWESHDGQFRRDGKTPYIVHPQKVASFVKTDAEKAVAWLHDTIEDVPHVTVKWLLDKGIPLDIALGVKAMTHSSTDDYFKDYLPAVKQNPLARAVKIADIQANLSDSPTQKQLRKYGLALLYLTHEDDEILEELGKLGY